MVRIAPNSAHVRGTVVGVQDVGDPSGFLQVSLRVADVASVKGTRNLLRAAPGDELLVLMAPDAVERLSVRPGVELDCEVRRADHERSFVHPDRVLVQAPDTEPDTVDAPGVDAPGVDATDEPSGEGDTTGERPSS